ncbi:MAG: hypothetical protein ACO1SX_16500 [Actinomycetota bacterium]
MRTLLRPNQLTYGFIRLQSDASRGEDIPAAVGMLALGLFGMGWQFWIPEVGLRIRPLSLYHWMSYLVPFTLGLLAALWGCRRLYTLPWLGAPTGEIARGRGGSPRSFTFRFSQPARLPLRAAVTVSLVLRETIRGVDGEGKPTVRHCDHLVATHPPESFRLGAGEYLDVQSEFELPERGCAGFHVGEAPLSWVAQVLVVVRGVSRYWREYPLPLAVVAGAVSDKSAMVDYSVRLLRYPGLESAFTPPKPLVEVAPHLDGMLHPPFTVREAVTRDVAEQICRRLEAVGAVLELRQGEVVVPRARVHDLPMPLSVENGGAPSRPIAVQAVEEAPAEVKLQPPL